MKIIAGAERSRPAFNELLREAEAKRFNVIICKSQSRFCRDLAIVETLINERFAELGIRFIGLSDNTDTAIRENRS